MSEINADEHTFGSLKVVHHKIVAVKSDINTNTQVRVCHLKKDALFADFKTASFYIAMQKLSQHFENVAFCCFSSEKVR
jgi:hypothetical protein